MPETGSIGLFTREITAIFDGRMSSFVRPIDPQPYTDQATDGLCWKGCLHGDPQGLLRDAAYRPGDQLWAGEMAYITPATASVEGGNVVDSAGRQRIVGYAADLDDQQVRDLLELGARKKTWTNMPRWASRFSLMITSSRILRLHSLTPRDLLCLGFVDEDGAPDPDALRSFWHAEFSARGPAWPVNPWVRLDSFTPVYQVRQADAVDVCPLPAESPVAASAA